MNHTSSKELQISTRSSNGADKKKSKELAKELNVLLAGYSLFYQNVRGYHWNIRGKEFFELHVKFEELYGRLYEKIDELAERIVTLGHFANFNYSDYKVSSKINESVPVVNGVEAAEDILSSLNVLISQQREILALATSSNDQGTALLLTKNIKEQEKLAWMYSAYLDR
jgi:starvation-inducible DNA-binding protein